MFMKKWEFLEKRKKNKNKIKITILSKKSDFLQSLSFCLNTFF